MGGTVVGSGIVSAAVVGAACKGVGVLVVLGVARASIERWRASGAAREELGGGDNVLRCLLASLLLSSSFRRKVLARGRDPLHAKTPELGLDAGVLYAAAERLTARQVRYGGGLVLATGALVAAAVAGWPLLATIAFMVVAGVAVIESHDTRFNWLPLFHRDVFERALALEKLGLEELAESHGPDETVAWSALVGTDASSSRRLVIYQGPRPFVGTGTSVGRWSLAVDTKRSPRLFGQLGSPEPVNARDVYAVAERALRGATSARVAVDDYLFVHGADLRPGTWVLPSRQTAPLTVVPETAVREINGSGEFNGRYYRWIRLSDPQSDVVLSYLLRCCFHGVRTLGVEVEKVVLGPLAPRYRQVDCLPSLEGGAVIAWGLATVLMVPLRVFSALREVWSAGWHALGQSTGLSAARRRQQLAREPRHNYGARESLRELVSTPTLDRYFQESDLLVRSKSAEGALFGALADFFEDKNIDVAVFRAAQMAAQEPTVELRSGHRVEPAAAFHARAAGRVAERQVG